MKKNSILYFIIGTEAELIKMFPTMLILKDKKIPYRIIATGQNDISKSPFLNIVNKGKIDLNIIGKKVIKKNAFGLLNWYLTTEKNGKNILSKRFAENKESVFFVVHGDTLSTVMGARIAKYLKIPYAHVEAGYRSWNYFCPFPEEFDRLYSSYHANLIFCAGEQLINNIKSLKGKKIDTCYNTILDSINYSLKNSLEKRKIKEKYFLLSIHRQENLINKYYLEKIIDNIEKISQKMTCLMFMHPQTEFALKRFGLLNKLKDNKNIKLYPRVPYFEFLKAAQDSEFVITDGAGNQQELYYLGIPTLIMRYKVEGKEGLGKNIVLFGGNFDKILSFLKDYKKYKKPMIKTKVSPSEIIAKYLINFIKNEK